MDPELEQAVRRMMKNRGWNFLCVLDDILLIADDFSQCYNGNTELIRLVRALGFALPAPSAGCQLPSVDFTGKSAANSASIPKPAADPSPGLWAPGQWLHEHGCHRGAASVMFQAGLPGEVSQIMGNWKSDAYKLYLDIDIDSKFKLIHPWTELLPSTSHIHVTLTWLTAPTMAPIIPKPST